MSKHTKGPWIAKNSGPHWNNNKISNWTINYGDDEEHIVDHVYEEADARLMAAAPELLEALEQTQILLKMLWLQGSDEYQANAAVIAKAKGGQ